MKNISIDKTIVLVGMMGCGKSAIGKRLATKLSLPFKDLDHVISANENMSVSKIFARKGESYFREQELVVINEILAGDPCVLATGGGAFMNPKIREAIAEKGISLWIHAEFDVLLERVSRKKTRPLLENGDKSEILRKLMDERYPIYQQSDIKVTSTDSPHSLVIKDIVEALK